MAEVRVHVFSMLAVRRVALQGTFLEKFPHPWLIWEPVVWKPSALNPISGKTLPASFSSRPVERPEGDALCYELLSAEPIKVGRAPDCDIRINDAAVSREHLWLEPSPPGGWRVRPVWARAATLIDGAPLPVEGVELRPHVELRVGGIILRFEDAASMAARLLDAAQ